MCTPLCSLPLSPLLLGVLRGVDGRTALDLDVHEVLPLLPGHDAVHLVAGAGEEGVVELGRRGRVERDAHLLEVQVARQRPEK